MIRFTQGNLLDADVEAIVNTVNTVGVMGKGIALMFKERFPENFKAYEAACRRKEVAIGKMFVSESPELHGPRWIINFPTKTNWRFPSKLEWIASGIDDLKRVILDKGIKSIALPPLGSGNGKLDWRDVRPLIEKALGDLPGVETIIYEPTRAYQNVTKTTGKEDLTPARAMVAEIVRRYEVLGFECSVLEVQKLAWVLSRMIAKLGLVDPLKLKFVANRYGPYADNLRHLLDNLDGSYLHSDKRLADAKPGDVLHFAPDHQPKLSEYFRRSEGAMYVEAIELTDALIDGFQSPLGMEALATVDWLLGAREDRADSQWISWPRSKPGPLRVRQSVSKKLFSDKLLQAALERAADTVTS